MGLPKGTTNNPKGRPLGSKNKIGEEMRGVFQQLLTKNISTLERDLKKLDSKERLQLLLKIAEFVVPKLKSIDGESKISDQEYEEFLQYKKRQEKYASMSIEEREELLRKATKRRAI